MMFSSLDLERSQKIRYVPKCIIHGCLCNEITKECKKCYDEDLAMDIKYYGKQTGLTKYAKIVSKKACDICSFGSL